MRQLGATVDFVAREGFDAGRALIAGTGDSIVRADPTKDGDTSGDWQLRSPASPDSGASEPPPPPSLHRAPRARSSRR